MIKITRTPNADTRTSTKPIDKNVLLESSKEHIVHVSMGLEMFSEMLNEAANKHDWTKITYIDEFASDAATGKCGAEFKALSWFKKHVALERHHLRDRCPDDVNLIDLLERIADITMAGLSRSGKIYDDEIPPEILQLAYKNTIELLKANVEVEANQ
jgi:arsenate reductase-like glutaredoxin family protein